MIPMMANIGESLRPRTTHRGEAPRFELNCLCWEIVMRITLLFAFALTTWAADGWKPIFDGKSLDGWKANERPASWTVRDGSITGDGEASHPFLHWNGSQWDWF